MATVLWAHMFHLDLPVLEKILRPVIVYVFLVVSLRLAGKRELAQLNPFDLVVLLTLSNTVQNAIIGDDTSVTGGVVGAATLLGINYLVVRFFFRHQVLEELLEGDPDVLVEDGRVNEERLAQELITRAELEAAARKQGFGSLDEVARAILDPGGTLSFVAKTPTTETVQYRELLSRLDQLRTELAALRGDVASAKA